MNASELTVSESNPTFERKDVPKINPATSDEETSNLDKIQSFLLSRIDGELTVEQLCKISETEKPETLSALQELASKGVVIFSENPDEQTSPAQTSSLDATAASEDSSNTETGFDAATLLQENQRTWETQKARRAILGMFSALNIQEAVHQLVPVLTWDLSDEAHADIEKFLVDQLDRNIEVFEQLIQDLRSEEIPAIVDFAEKLMPQSRSVMLDLLEQTQDPELRLKILKSLRGQWQNKAKAKRVLVPLTTSANVELRIEVLRHLAQVNASLANQHIKEKIDTDLLNLPESQLRDFLDLFIQTGGTDAIETLRSLIQKRGFVSDNEIELAKHVAHSLVKSPTPRVLHMLEDIEDSWFVPSEIKETCREVLDTIGDDVRDEDDDLEELEPDNTFEGPSDYLKS